MVDIATILTNAMSPFWSIICVLSIIMLFIGGITLIGGRMGGFIVMAIASIGILIPMNANASLVPAKCEKVAVLFVDGKAAVNEKNRILFMNFCGSRKYKEVFDIRLKKK